MLSQYSLRMCMCVCTARDRLRSHLFIMLAAQHTSSYNRTRSPHHDHIHSLSWARALRTSLEYQPTIHSRWLSSVSVRGVESTTEAINVVHQHFPWNIFFVM